MHIPNNKLTVLVTVLVFCCILLIISGCLPVNGPSGSFGGVAKNGAGAVSAKAGQLSLFLNVKEQKGVERMMVIQSIEILAENSIWIPLDIEPIRIDSQRISWGQMFLGRTSLAVGYYSALRLKTTLYNQSTDVELEPTEIELQIRNPLYVGKGDSHAVFFLWDLSVDTFVGGASSRPNLSLAPKLKNMLVDVAYVACPDIDTVYMICTDKNRVCDSLGVRGGPGYLISDPNAPTANLFALTERDMDIKRIGPSSNRVEESFHLSRLGRELFFAISPDSRWGYVVDRKRGNILRLNLHSGAIDGRKRLGYGPTYIIYLEKQGLLAVTLSQSQTVALLDAQTMNQVGSISTGRKPGGLMLYRDNFLYIAEEGGNSLMVYDLSLNKIKKRIPVGLAPRRLLAADDRIFVANYNSKTISLVRPGQLSVTKDIAIDGSPLELAYSSKNKWLYVGNESTNSLDIIEPVNGKKVGAISLGARPGGIAIVH